MCGRFAQYSSRDEYFESLGLEPDEILYDPEPIGRFNVAPGTKVLLLNERDEELHFEPIYWDMVLTGGTSSHSLMPAVKQPLRVASSNPSGIMVV